MLTTSCNLKATQPFCGVSRFSDPVARRLGSFLLLIITLFLSSVACAQSNDDTEQSGIVPPVDTAPVVVNGRVQFHVVGVSAHPAKRRAQEIAGRIEALAKDRTFDPKTLRVEDVGEYHTIFPGESGKAILSVLEADANSEGVVRDVLAETLRRRIAESIENYRRDRQPGALMANTLYALGSTVALVVVLCGVFWGFRFLDRRIKRQSQQVEARSKHIFQRGQVWHVLHGALRLLRVLVILILLYAFANYTLSLFPQTRYAASLLFQFVSGPLGDMMDALIGFIPELIFLIVLFVITRAALKLARGVFAAIEDGRLKIKGFETDWTWPTYRILRVVIVLFSLVIAYPYLPGSDSAAFQGVSIMLGVLFSLGSTSVIANVIAGYTMTYRRAFRMGDWVKIGGTVGKVMEMRVLVTHLRTRKNEEVVIPNSTILNNEVTNYSNMARSQGLILHTKVGIGYEVPWRQVEAMLLLAADRTEGLLKEPKPFMLQQSLADFAVNYEINAYCDDASRMLELYSEMHCNIQDVFNENGVQIMTPSYRADPVIPKVVPKERWHTPLTNKPG